MVRRPTIEVSARSRSKAYSAGCGCRPGVNFQSLKDVIPGSARISFYLCACKLRSVRVGLPKTPAARMRSDPVLLFWPHEGAPFRLHLVAAKASVQMVVHQPH